MVRSFGIGLVVLGLACAGRAFSQQPASAPATGSGERIVTVQENGQAAQKCRVLKTWRQADGSTVYQVQSLKSGDILTLVEPRAGASPVGGLRIFHWGKDRTPPPGTPMPPVAERPAPTPPATTPRPSWTAVAPTPTPTPRLTPVPAPSRVSASAVTTTPSTTSTPTPGTTPLYSVTSSTPSTASSPYSGRTQASTAPPASAASPYSPTGRSSTNGAAAAVAPYQRWPAAAPTGTAQATPTPSGTSPCPCSATVPGSVTPCPCSSKPGSRLTGLFKGSSDRTPCGCDCTTTTPSTVVKPCPTCTPVSPTVVKTCPTCTPTSPTVVTPCPTCTPASPTVVTTCPSCTTASPPRQGLVGRLRQPKKEESATCVCQPATVTPSPVTAKPAEATVQKATEPAKPGDYRQSWGKVEPWKPTRTQADNDTTKKPAPKTTVTTVSKPKPVQTVRTPTETRYPDPAKDPAWFHERALSGMAAKTKPAAMPEDRSPPPAGGASVTDKPGMQSVMAARAAAAAAAAQGASRDEMANAFGNFPPMLPNRPPSPPNPYPPTRPMVPAPMAQDAAVATGLANAFTIAENARPIPADFSPQMVEANAFAPTDNRQPIVTMMPVPNGFSPRNPAPGMPGVPPGTALALAGAPRGPMGPAGYGPGMPYAPAAYHPAMLPAARPSAPQTQAAPAAMSTPQLLSMLKDSLYPSHREWPCDCLSRQDWRSQPQVVPALLTAAKEDPAATVRAGCVRALANMKVNTLPVVTAVQALKADADPRVRLAVEDALPALGVASDGQTDNNVRPASGRLP